MAFTVPDELLPMILPTAVYWIGSGIYTLLMDDKNRLFTQEEEDARNLVSRRQAVVGTLVNQSLQMGLVAFSYLVTRGGKGDGGQAGTSVPQLSLLRMASQLAAAVVLVDAWQYFWHRLTHENKFIYKHVHAMHHRLVVPYAYGAQYSHPIDSFFGDAVGTFLVTVVTGMSPRLSTFFLTLITVKGIDDHCGMWFPNNPFHRFLTNNAAMHTVHHQRFGIKHNFSVFFSAFWDKLLGTYMPAIVEERDGGGYQLAERRSC